MTPKQFQAQRVALGLRQIDLAEAFDYSIQSIRLWEQERQALPVWAQQLICFYAQYGVPKP